MSSRKLFQYSDITLDPDLIALSAEIGESLSIPEFIQLLPTGKWFYQGDQVEVTTGTIQQFIDNFNSSPKDVVIDYEHATHETHFAPASGWVKELINRGENGLWARVVWTEKAADLIKNGEYRYISPAFKLNAVDKDSGKNVGAKLFSVALTNLPFLEELQPLSLFTDKARKENTMLEKLLKALGLKKDATEKEAMDAITSFKAAIPDDVLKACGLESGSTTEVVEKIKAFKDEKDDSIASKEVLNLFSLKEDASLDDFKAARVALQDPGNSDMAKELADLKKKILMKERDELVEGGIKAGKITPASKEWAEDYAMKDPEGFKLYLAKAAVVVDTTNLEQPEDEVKTFSAVDLEVAKLCGHTKEDLEKFSAKQN